MNGDLTVRDVMTREFVGVNEGDPIAGVADLMVEAGAGGAVVLRGSEPLGWVDARDVVAVVAAGSDPSDVSAGDAMSESTATIGPDETIREAISTFAARDLRQLVVVEGGEVLGVLSEHDVITAQSTVPDAPPTDLPPRTVGGQPTADDRFSTQSVCEACGTLADSLAGVNGQLLCADCREM